MDYVVLWLALIVLIKPHYPKSGSNGGRPPYPLATILWMPLMHQWYSLSDPEMEDPLAGVPKERWFAGIDLLGKL